MYNLIKKILKTFLPNHFIFKNELFLRKFMIPFYKGKKYQCPICKKNWKHFLKLSDGDLICPYCACRSRTRRLYRLLQEEKALSGKMLHFSPSRSLYRKFKSQPDLDYYSTDFENEFLAEMKLDITDIHLKSNIFDSVICYHILEHIITDGQAMAEVFRILKPGGNCFIQTPFKFGKTYEDASITTEEGRLKAFGQKDHVRIYALEDLKAKLKNNGFQVSVYNFEQAFKPYGLKKESVLKASKPKQTY